MRSEVTSVPERAGRPDIATRPILGRFLVARRPDANPFTVAVLLPVEERFDGTGGAVAAWVRNAYAPLRGRLSFGIFCPAVDKSFSGELPVVHLRSYEILDRLLRRISRLTGAMTRRNPHGILRLLTLQGVLWVWWCRPALASADVVHVHNRPGYAVQLRRAKYTGRIVMHMHNDPVDSVESHIARGIGPRRNTAEIVRSVDHWVFCSAFLQRRAIDMLGIAEERTGVLYNGATVRAEPRQPSGPHDVVSAVFAGRLIPEKGVLEAVRAVGVANRSQPTTLDIYGGKATGASSGSSDYIRLVEREAKRVNLESGTERVRLHGFVTPEVLLARMAQADVLLHPCRWDEPFGMVLVDAMSVGTPVIAPERGGIPEIVTDGVDGRLLRRDAGDDEYATALLELACSTDYQLIARRAMEKAGSVFSWGVISRELLAALGGPLEAGEDPWRV